MGANSQAHWAISELMVKAENAGGRYVDHIMQHEGERLSPTIKEPRAEHRLAVLASVGRIAAESSDLFEAAPDLLSALCEPLGFESGTLWLADGEEGSLRAVAAWSLDSVSASPSPVAEDPIDPSMVTRRALGSGRAKWSKSVGAVPLSFGGSVLGVVEVAPANLAGSEVRSTLEAAASQIAGLMGRVREKGLESTSQSFHALVEHIPAITYTNRLTPHLSATHVSAQVETLLGITPEEWIETGDLWFDLLHAEDRERARGEYARGCEAQGSFSLEYRMISRDGRVLWFRDHAVVVVDDKGRPAFVQGMMLDISERKQAEEQAQYLAYHDKLTGLPNRAMFEELLDMALSRAGRHDLGVAVLRVDLDDFRLVNESLGHEAGDQLLHQVAERLRAATRETDVVARQGGDEFLLLLSDLDDDSREPDRASRDQTGLLIAESVAARVRDSLWDPFVLAGTELFISASTGISLFPHDAADAKALLRNSDAAMYRSKKAGPAGYVVYSVQESDSVRRLSLSTRLRKAVERQHWVLHYQPVIDLPSGETVGAEALLRWSDPSGGLVAPGEFIPMAEEMGLIEAIGEWVLAELCRQSKEWKQQGLELDVSFNLSPRELWRPNLVQSVLGRLSDAGVSAESVIVEITESTAMTDPDRTGRILSELHGSGLRLAIDDFGTGYSSLSRLKNMPVDILKIDRSFIRDIPGDEDAGSMVKAIIQLANSLGMVPLAEGIETDDQSQFLLDNGCALGQGYHFARPMPAAEFLSLARRRRMRLIGDAAS